jgi:DNA (cytosine-5)-methyltransferase 1
MKASSAITERMNTGLDASTASRPPFIVQNAGDGNSAAVTAYYNENDPYAAQWLRNLIEAGHIAPGDVDERSIVDVRGSDLAGYGQCHFFAGIGGWSYALRLAGWPDDLAVWTGSCPCQPLSSAGQRKGHADQRHLWPTFYGLIAECSPAILFGEQVASTDGREWLAGVRADLETSGYACGAADLPAACAGAPHCRQRYFWMAVAAGKQVGLPRQSRLRADAGDHGKLGNGDENGRKGTLVPIRQRRQIKATALPSGTSEAPELELTNGSHGYWWDGPLQVGWNAIEGEIERSGRRYRAQWRIKPGLSLVAHGIPNRMERVSAYGNAIVPQVAAEFIAAAREAIA